MQGSLGVKTWMSKSIERVSVFKQHIWDQSQVTTVWDTGETGDIN